MAVALDILAIILASGAAFYLYQTSAALKEDVMGRGMALMTVALVIIVVNGILDLLDDLEVTQLYTPIHYFTRIVFIVVLLVGASLMVQGWKRLK
ncbi:MAG TPA: hypothetical protein VLV18_00570 [Terriglobales bacterium]|nr:hypothetical protein [Terriglobales bacterium]